VKKIVVKSRPFDNFLAAVAGKGGGGEVVAIEQ